MYELNSNGPTVNHLKDGATYSGVGVGVGVGVCVGIRRASEPTSSEKNETSVSV